MTIDKNKYIKMMEINMKIVKLVALVLLVISVESEAGKWQKLKPLASYGGDDYRLSDNVAYMQIRGYGDKKSSKPSKIFTLSKEPKQGYSHGMIEKFKNLKPKYSSRADINTFGYGNAFFIDTDGKMFQMDMRKDIISLLGVIDRPAELQLLLQLTHYKEGQYYRKTSKGYEVKISYPIKGCIRDNREVFIDKKGLLTERKSNFVRKGCKPRKHTKFINNKKVNYQGYLSIAMDREENLYVIGEAMRGADGYSSTFYKLEKYTQSGKRIWSKKLRAEHVEDLIVDHNSLYVLASGAVVEKYNFRGKKLSLGKNNKAKFSKNIKQQQIKKGQYIPEGLPSKKDAIDAQINAYAKDKKGNVYIAGSEIFYPSGSPEEIPSGLCGNTEQILGALIAKLNPKGETVWAKVLDADR